MQKKKVKEKRLRHRLTLWLSVLFLGLLVGISIQFTRAWVEPSTTVTAPDGNIAAPINTGASVQKKIGKESQKADFCVDPYGRGEEKCLSDLVSFPACTLAGGIPTTIGGTITLCKFPGASCPSPWVQYLKYTETTVNTCTGAGDCGTSATTGNHAFANIDPLSEKVDYTDCTSSWNPQCYITNNCPPGIWHGDNWCEDGETWNGCSSSSSTTKPCLPNITFVGCLPS